MLQYDSNSTSSLVFCVLKIQCDFMHHTKHSFVSSIFILAVSSTFPIRKWNSFINYDFGGLSILKFLRQLTTCSCSIVCTISPFRHSKMERDVSLLAYKERKRNPGKTDIRKWRVMSLYSLIRRGKGILEKQTFEN